MNRKPSFVPFTFHASPFAATNPFTQAAPEPVVALAADAVWSQDTFEGEDLDVPAPEAVDVRVVWGTNVLHFEQMSPPRAFTLGATGSDFTLPELGVTTSADATCPLVIMRDDRPSVFVAKGATAEVKLTSGRTLSFAQCVEGGTAHASSEHLGAYEIVLDHGATATVHFPESEIAFEVTRCRARQQPESGLFAGADLSGQIYTGLSALVHATLIGALAFFLPAMHGDDAEALDRNATAAALQPYLTAIAEREPPKDETVTEGASSTEGGGGAGSQAALPSGTMGTTVPTPTTGRFAIRGDSPDPKVARELALSEAASFGMLGLLNTDTNASNSPVAPWGESVASGRDTRNALGALWASNIDDSAGAGGLGISGTGIGGGGLFQGIGINGIGSTIGGGSGTCDGPCQGGGPGPGRGFGPPGIGQGHDPGHGGHIPTGPVLRSPSFEASGSLPAEVIQRVVRQNFGRFKLCYEAGLRSNPGLSGRVAVSFIIDRSGAVAVAAADRSTDMADPNVVSCVVRGFQNISFPEPKNGMVKVVYPLVLSPGE